MPKAGKYEYPFFDLIPVIDKLKKIHQVLRDDEIDRSLVAETLGMSEKGGGFAYLISSMEKYGLIKTGGGKIVITDLGKIVMYGEASEQGEAMSKAVMNVELFNELYSQYGETVTEEQIRAFLRQKALVDIVKAQKIAPKVSKIYKKVLTYMFPAEKLADESSESAEQIPSLGGRDNIIQMNGQDGEQQEPLLKIQYGSLYIQVTKEDAEIALKQIAPKFGLVVSREKMDGETG